MNNHIHISLKEANVSGIFLVCATNKYIIVFTRFFAKSYFDHLYSKNITTLYSVGNIDLQKKLLNIPLCPVSTDQVKCGSSSPE